MTCAPGATLTSVVVGPSSASLTSRRRAIAVSKADRRVGSSRSAASRITAAGTRNSAGTTPSKRWEYSASAAAPRSATPAQIGRTASVAAATSNAARGTTDA